MCLQHSTSGPVCARYVPEVPTYGDSPPRRCPKTRGYNTFPLRGRVLLGVGPSRGLDDTTVDGTLTVTRTPRLADDLRGSTRVVHVHWDVVNGRREWYGAAGGKR